MTSPMDQGRAEESRFRVAVERDGDCAILVVEGDVDLHSAPCLRDELAMIIEGDASRVVVDLSETTFLDSMALGVLLGAKKGLAARGAELELVVTRSDIRRIFEITMLERVFALHSSRSDAIRRVGAG